jgi:hypothetical protein
MTIRYSCRCTDNLSKKAGLVDKSRDRKELSHGGVMEHSLSLLLMVEELIVIGAVIQEVVGLLVLGIL